MSEEHYCTVHNTEFFKRGKMRGYAHPLQDENGEDTGEWCNEKDLEKVKNLKPQPSDKLLSKDQKIIDDEVKVRPAPQDNRSKEIEFNMWCKIAAEMVGNIPLMAYIEQNFKSGKEYRRALALMVITQSLEVLPVKIERVD